MEGRKRDGKGERGSDGIKGEHIKSSRLQIVKILLTSRDKDPTTCVD